MSATGYGVTAKLQRRRLARLDQRSGAARTTIDPDQRGSNRGHQDLRDRSGCRRRPGQRIRTAASTLTAMAVAGGTGGYFPGNQPAAADQRHAGHPRADPGRDPVGRIGHGQYDRPEHQLDGVPAELRHLGRRPGLDRRHQGLSDQSGHGHRQHRLRWSGVRRRSSMPRAAGNGWDTNRLIATWDPVAGAGIPFRWTAGTPTSGIATSTILGQELETNTCRSERSACAAIICVAMRIGNRRRRPLSQSNARSRRHRRQRAALYRGRQRPLSDHQLLRVCSRPTPIASR